MTATQRAVVDDLGNINIHGRSALQIVWKVKNAEGAFLNISASDLFIEIAGSIRVALTAGEDDYSRKLSLTRAQIAALPLNQPLSYALHDETPSSAATIWSGKITAYGFRAAPPGADAVEPGTASWTGATVTVMQGESVPTVVVTYMGATGYGIPTGGTVGQYLRKASATNFDTAWDTVTGSDVGLGNVDNTSDANKPVSTAQQAALDLKLNLAGGTMSGVLATIAGTAALPGLAVAGDLNTGVYGVSADVLGVSAGGVMVQTWAPGIATVAGVVRPDADATRDLGTVSARWRDGFLSRGLYVGSGGASSLPNGAGGSFTPTLGIQANSGVVGLSAGLIDGVNNRRAGLFVNDTAGVWGLSHTYSAGASPFVMVIGGNEVLRLTTGGLLGLGIVPTSFLHVAGATGATLNTTYEPAGWSGLKSRVGNQYRGDGLVSSVNVRLTSLTAGTLDDPTQPGSALVLLADGTLTLVDTTAGSGVRTFAPMFAVSGTGVATLYNNLLFGTDNSFDVGALGANRARSIYAGTSFIAPLGAVGTPSFTFTGDSNTGMWSPAADTLAWSTGGTERMRISSSGNVGIGIGSVGQRLVVGDVTGQNTVRINGLSTADMAPVLSLFRSGAAEWFISAGSSTATTSLVIGIAAAGYSDAQLDAAARFVIQSGTGSVGIGTTAPLTRLHTTGNITFGGAAMGGPNTGQLLALSAGSPVSVRQTFGTDGSGWQYRIAKDVAGTITDLVTVVDSGRVGIGTTSPSTLLHVAGVTTLGDHLVAGADNTYDIGASGASRPRNLYTASTIYSGAGYFLVSGGRIEWGSRSILFSPSDGVLLLQNNAQTDFSRLQFGGTTSAFPAIKRSGAAINIRLADDSAFANLAANEGDFTGRVSAFAATAIPAGGTAGAGFRVSSTANFGVFFGSGAPTLSAAKGSLYLRSDGSGTSDRMYVNTDGATAWTAVTTAA